MSFSPTEQIRGCRSLQELESVWTANVKRWSQLPGDQAKALIQVKNEHKRMLMDAEVDQAVHKLDQVWREHGTAMEDISIEKRQHALELEAGITKAANAGDVAGFRDAVSAWRRCWMPEMKKERQYRFE
jgi:hypothetical protein